MKDYEEIFIQTKNVGWLDTPKGTIWIPFFGTNIQPQDPELRTSAFGVDLDTLEDETLFRAERQYIIT